MDVLRPALININGRIYRRNALQEEFSDEEPQEPSFVTDECVEEACDSHEIEETERGFQCSIHTPPVLYKYIIGKKGETRKRLEADTKTSISIPKPGAVGPIVVSGSLRTAVLSAVTRLEVLTDSFRRKQPFTHFLSLPLNHPQFQEGFLRFREQVMELCREDSGVDASIFQNPAKLHLTVGTLVLLDEQEVLRARDVLQQCADSVRAVTEGADLPVAIRGIEYMNDDPSAVDVLYAKVLPQDGSERLQQVVQLLVDRFTSAGLMECERERVKIHATVMNTLFRRDQLAEGASGRTRAREREAFDARNILQLLTGFEFGLGELTSIQISQRFSSDSAGYYSCVGSISFSGS